MKLWSTLGIRSMLLFVVGFSLLLPFPFSLLPNSGNAFLPITATITATIGKALSLLPGNYEVHLDSDSRGLYVFTLLLFVLSCLIALGWSLVKRKKGQELEWLKTYSAYYLALILLIYGFDKVFKHQFYLPEPNTLYTPLGDLRSDLLYWSTVGSSWSYSFFTGLLEVIAALLLIFRRTRDLGALLSVAILLHVSLINFGFDVSVKLFSGFLLLLAVLLAGSPFLKLIRVFVLQKEVQPNSTSPFINNKISNRNYWIIKTAIVCIFFTEAVYGFVTYAGFNDDKSPRPYLHGAYEVTEQFNDSNQLVLPFTKSTTAIERIFIHRKGYLIFQTTAGEVKDYKLMYDTTAHQLITSYENEAPVIWKYSFQNDTLVLQNTGTQEKISARKLNWEKLPLLHSGWSWFSD